MKRELREWPEDFEFDENKKKYAKDHGMDPSKFDDFWVEFKDYCLANGKKYKDWDAAFRTRVRNAKEWNQFQRPYIPRAVGRAHKVNDINSLSKAFEILSKKGTNEFTIYCNAIGMPEEDQECVLNKFNKTITLGMIKEKARCLFQGVGDDYQISF